MSIMFVLSETKVRIPLNKKCMDFIGETVKDI